MQLRHAANTDTGRTRDHNEDTYAVEPAPQRSEAGALFVVCDGMGGFAAGEVASDLAATTIKTRYYAAPANRPDAALRDAFLEANERIFQEGRGKMGTTGVAALFVGDEVILANVGDSRAYLLKGGAVEQLTQDHSFVAEQVAAGVLTADQARDSSYRNIITRALGHRAEVEVDLFHRPVAPGDRVLLCSDGLHGQVEPAEIAKISGSGELEPAVKELIDLANRRGGPDNITAVLVEVVAVDGANGVAARGQTGTERLKPEPSAPAQTAKLPAAASVPDARSARLQPAHLRPAAPPARPAPHRGPIVGLILMVLVVLALLGGFAWFLVNNGLGQGNPAPAPTVPALTPLGVTASPRSTITPTFVPATTPTVRPAATARP